MIVNELELILSPSFKNILIEMDHQISDDLLLLHIDSKTEFKKTFISLGSTPDKVSFIQSNKVQDLVEPEIVHGSYKRNPDRFKEGQEGNWMGEFEYTEDIWKNPWIQKSNTVIDLHEVQFSDDKHPVWTKNRSEVKIGRFISQMFPGKYPTNVRRGEEKKLPNDVESFVNMFIASVEANAKTIVEVKGDDIKKFYHQDRYAEINGTLGGSCMREDCKQAQFGIYTENTENVSMLILHPQGDREKIIGRAILWKISHINDEPVTDKYFMDRFYVVNDSDEYMFKDYAKKMGYYHKSVQTYGSSYDIVRPDGNNESMNIKVTLNPIDFNDKYPYMDTLQYYNPKTGELKNSNSGYISGKFCQLTDYMGPAQWYE